MQKWQFAAVVLGISIVVAFTCGCTGQAVAPQPTQIAEAPTSSVTAMATATTRPTVCHMEGEMKVCLYSDRTPVMTTVPTKIQTTAPLVEAFDSQGNPVEDPSISGPLAAPVMLTGVGNDIVWFEVAHPGIVTIKMRNGFGSQVVKNCEEKYFRVALAGKSIDSVIYDKGMALSTVTRTATIPLEGRYSLSVKSCGQWEIKIS